MGLTNGTAFVDVTVKGAPVRIATTTYPQLAYVHQGWLTEDHRFFLLGDEMDEIEFGLSTRTHVFDVSDLDAPAHLYALDLGTRATDAPMSDAPDDEAGTHGAWSVYPYLPSGTILVSDIANGLFVLAMD